MSVHLNNMFLPRLPPNYYYNEIMDCGAIKCNKTATLDWLQTVNFTGQKERKTTSTTSQLHHHRTTLPISTKLDHCPHPIYSHNTLSLEIDIVKCFESVGM